MHADMVNLADGSILTVIDNTVLISEDGGKSWLERAPCAPARLLECPAPACFCALRTTGSSWSTSIRTRLSGTGTTRREAPTPTRGWTSGAIRSPDGGKTWLDRQRIYEGYCGALINMVELARGGIVAPIQVLLRDPDRHAMTSYRSEDDGLTWSHANIIDGGATDTTTAPWKRPPPS